GAHALHGPGEIQRRRRAGDLSPGARARPPHARRAAVCCELGRSRFPALLPTHGDGGRVAVRSLDSRLGRSGGFRGHPGPDVHRGGPDHDRRLKIEREIMSLLTQYLLPMTILAAVGSGAMAGLFFAFSNSVMKALSRLPAEQGMAAMQFINVIIL